MHAEYILNEKFAGKIFRIPNKIKHNKQYTLCKNLIIRNKMLSTIEITLLIFVF